MMSRYNARAREYKCFIQRELNDFFLFTCKHVLLRGDGVLVVTAHHHLGVVHQVEGEEDRPRPPVHHLHVLGVRDEDHHDPEDHEAAEEAHQDAAHGREVPLGLNKGLAL